MFVRKANKEHRLHLRLQSYAASASDHPSVAAVPSVLQSASVSGEVLWTRRTHNSRHAVVRGKHRRGLHDFGLYLNKGWTPDATNIYLVLTSHIIRDKTF